MAFLTTETNVSGNYQSIRVIYATICAFRKNSADMQYLIQVHETTMKSALAKLSQKADAIGARGVIGVSHTITDSGAHITVTMLGTAVK